MARCTVGCAGTPQHEHSRLVAERSKHTESRWMDALTLPARAARFAVVDAPFSSKLEVTGVSLMLQSHEARQPGVTLRAATPQKSSGESMPDRPAQTPPSWVHVPAVTPPANSCCASIARTRFAQLNYQIVNQLTPSEPWQMQLCLSCSDPHLCNAGLFWASAWSLPGRPRQQSRPGQPWAAQEAEAAAGGRSSSCARKHGWLCS